MMMDTAVQQQTDSNGQVLITSNERQALIQKLNSRWPAELSMKIEKEAFEKSHGLKNQYLRLIHVYYQHIQAQMQNRANQQQQMNNNNNLGFANVQTSSIPMVNQVSHQQNPMHNSTPRFSTSQQQPVTRMMNPNPNPMARLREPQKFTSIQPTIDLSQGYSAQQISNSNTNDFPLNQPRYPIQPSMTIPRQRLPLQTNTNDIIHQYVTGNSTTTTTTTTVQPSPTIINGNVSSSGDQLLQRILSSTIDATTNPISVQSRPPAPSAVLSQPIRSINPNSLRPSLSPSPSVVIIPPSTIQIQPSTNLTIQQSPLNNSNGPHSASSQSTANSTPVLTNSTSPTPSGSISSPDDEILNLIKYLKDNVNRLQLLTQKFTNENNPDKLRQVQTIHQQILQFISNPTYETLPNAKHFRDILEKITNRTTPNTSQTNIFTQCLKATTDFLQRDHKDRINMSKRYLEPLTDVINGVPHKIMRLDIDHSSIIKRRTLTDHSLLTKITDELKQLSNEIFFIEQIFESQIRNSLNTNGIILKCQLREKLHPILPSIRLYIPRFYPEQAPEILSLTKTMPPKLEFSDGHSFFDQISSIFVSHLFKLPPQHTITDILNIWRQSVQTAL